MKHSKTKLGLALETGQSIFSGTTLKDDNVV